MSRTSTKPGSAAGSHPSVPAVLRPLERPTLTAVYPPWRAKREARPPALPCAIGIACDADPATAPKSAAWPTGAPSALPRSRQTGVSARAETPVFPTAVPAGLPRDASPKPQASALRPGPGIRRVLRDLRPRARVLAVVSGKGGVGKTSLAVNLAIGLAAAGRRILLLDADIGLANVDLLLGQRPRGHLGHVLTGQMALADVVQEGPAGPNPNALGPLPTNGEPTCRRLTIERLADRSPAASGDGAISRDLSRVPGPIGPLRRELTGKGQCHGTRVRRHPHLAGKR